MANILEGTVKMTSDGKIYKCKRVDMNETEIYCNLCDHWVRRDRWNSHTKTYTHAGIKYTQISAFIPDNKNSDEVNVSGTVNMDDGTIFKARRAGFLEPELYCEKCNVWVKKNNIAAHQMTMLHTGKNNINKMIFSI
jgi:hypothetical protein